MVEDPREFSFEESYPEQIDEHGFLFQKLNLQTLKQITPNNVMKLLKKEKLATTQQFIEDYTAFIKSAGKKELEELRKNVTQGTAKKINIKGIPIYGLTATDYKLDNPDDVVTTFLGHFSYQGQDSALITFLDAPHGLKSTYNFNSAGWNATELARKIVESVVLNANLAKR